MQRIRLLTILTALAVVIAACGEPIPPAETSTLTVTIEGDGTVTFDTADGDDAAGTSEHARDAEVTLVATPADGNTFVGWGGACAGTDATCVVTMDADKSVTAVFEAEEPLPEEVQLSVAFTGSSGGGTVTQADLGIACSYDPGTGETDGECGPVTASTLTAYTFEAEAAADMEFAGWAGDADAQCDDAQTSCELTPDKEGFVVVAVFVDPNVGAPVSRSVAVTDGADDGLEWVTAANTGEPEHGPGYTHSSLQYSGLAYVNRYEAEVINEFIFRDLDIPAGATITEAYIQFTSIMRTGNAAHVPSDGSDQINLLITAEASTNPDPIPHENDSNPISTRPTVGTTVTWTDVPDWAAKGDATEAQRTVDISALLQAVIDQDGWDESGDVGIVILNNDADATVGWRQIATFNEDPEAAPVLHFTYTAP